MAKTQRYSVVPKDHPRRKALDDLAGFRYSDLKGAVIKRGMEFEKVINSDHGRMADFFIQNYDKPVNPKKLEEFDKWMDLKLKEQGYGEDDPVRQFKQFTLEPEQEEEKPKKEKKVKIIKPKKEKNKEFGIFGGTKKELTYNLAKNLLAKKGEKYKSNKDLVKKFGGQLFDKVKEKFPDANDKSVNIWAKRALDQFRH